MSFGQSPTKGETRSSNFLETPGQPLADGGSHRYVDTRVTHARSSPRDRTPSGRRWEFPPDRRPIRGGRHPVALTWIRTHDWDAEDWRDLALCRDTSPELFFPIGTTGMALDQIAA